MRKLYPGKIETAGSRLRRERAYLETLRQQGSAPIAMSPASPDLPVKMG
ncbi:hypothetical protein [Sodalis sp. C49]